MASDPASQIVKDDPDNPKAVHLIMTYGCDECGEPIQKGERRICCATCSLLLERNTFDMCAGCVAVHMTKNGNAFATHEIKEVVGDDAIAVYTSVAHTLQSRMKTYAFRRFLGVLHADGKWKYCNFASVYNGSRALATFIENLNLRQTAPTSDQSSAAISTVWANKVKQVTHPEPHPEINRKKSRLPSLFSFFSPKPWPSLFTPPPPSSSSSTSSTSLSSSQSTAVEAEHASQPHARQVHVAIFAANSPKWVVAQFASVFLGGVCVPIHHATPPMQLYSMLQHGNVEVLVCDVPRYHKFLALLGNITGTTVESERMGGVRSGLDTIDVKQRHTSTSMGVTPDPSTTRSPFSFYTLPVKHVIIFEDPMDSLPSEDAVVEALIADTINLFSIRHGLDPSSPLGVPACSSSIALGSSAHHSSTFGSSLFPSTRNHSLTTLAATEALLPFFVHSWSAATALADKPLLWSRIRPATQEDEVRLLLFTSGSTGLPKAAIMSDALVLKELATISTLHNYFFFAFRPLAYSTEFIHLLEVVGNGGRMCFWNGDMNTFFQQLSATQVDIFSAPPRIWNILYAMYKAKLEMQLRYLQNKYHGNCDENTISTNTPPETRDKSELSLPFSNTTSALTNASTSTSSTISTATNDAFESSIAHALPEIRPMSSYICTPTPSPTSDEILSQAKQSVFKEFKQLFGKNLSFVATGGAITSPVVLEWMHEIFKDTNVSVQEGYGCTEAETISINGRRLRQCMLHLENVPELNYFTTDTPSRGLLWVHTNEMAKGYYRNTKETTENFKDIFNDGRQWFNTGKSAHIKARSSEVYS